MKKLLSIVLIVTMLMSMVLVAVPASATEASDGTNAELEAAGYIGITALNQIRGGGKFYLKNDVTVSGTQGLPAGSAANLTTLDGNGHTINYTGNNSLFGWSAWVHLKNLKVVGTITVTSDGWNVGGAISNGFDQIVILENVECDVDQYINANVTLNGGVVTKVQNGANVTMKNVVNKGDIIYGEGKKAEIVGGIVGYISHSAATKAEFIDCVNYGNITVEGAKDKALSVGGIVGRVEQNSASTLVPTFNGCENYGNITVREFSAASFAGGIAGFLIRRANVANCINGGNISFNATAENKNNGVGGIVGGLTSEDYDDGVITVDNCLNTGSISHNVSATHTGGILGKVHAVPTLTVSNCVNTGSVTAATNAGWQGNAGIVATVMTYNKDWHWSNVSKCDVTIYNCHNRGAITGMDAAGILSAGMELFGTNVSIKIDKCINSGAVNGKWQWGGGIAGRIGCNGGDTVNLTITNCVNKGAVSAQWEVGGIVAKVGYSAGTTTIENCANSGTITCNEGSTNKCAGVIRQCANPLTVKNCVDTASPAYPICPAADGMNTVTAEGNKFVKTDAGNGTAVSQDEANAAYLAVENAAYSAKTSSYIFDERQYPTGVSFNGKDIHLYTDVTLKTHGGNLENATLYGNGKTITLDGANTVIWWGKNVTVEDLTINGSITTSDSNKTDHVGSLSLHGFDGNSVIRNVVSNVDITVGAATGNVGGIISKNSGSILMERVAYNGTLVLNANAGSAFGGVIGQAISATFNNVANRGDITINANVGWGKAAGVAGDLNGTYVFENVENTGDITVTANCTTQYIGGIAGGIEPNSNVTFKNVRNNGDITSATGRNLGGIVGRSFNATISMEMVENTGDITMNGRGYVGGLAGFLQSTAFTGEKLQNSGDITATMAQSGDHKGVGGIIGGFDNNDTDKAVEISDAFNFGNVTLVKDGDFSKDVHVGGIVGRVYRVLSFKLDNAVNAGAVTYGVGTQYGWECVGGLVGGIMTPGKAAINEITNSVNWAPVTGTLATGGILGGTKQLNPNVVIKIDNCLNYGSIKAVSYAGGIAGHIGEGTYGDTYKAFYNLVIEDCFNVGSVRSTWTGGCGVGHASGVTTISSGGILGRYVDSGSANFAQIIDCVNVGSVTIDVESSSRGCDSWKRVGGILGDFNGEISITGCVHDGYLASKDGSAYGTFPITNAIETVYNGGNYYDQTFIGGLIKAENNIYAEGSALQETVKHVAGSLSGQWVPAYTLSTEADKDTLYARVKELQTPAYSGEAVMEIIDFIEKNYDPEKWSPASWALLETAIEEAQTLLMDINYNLNLGIFTDKQSDVNDAEMKILTAKDNLILAGDVCHDLKLAVAEAKLAVIGGTYTTESWNAYQEALAAAEALILQDTEADPGEVNAAIENLEYAVDSLVIGGSIRNADDFAAMDGQVGLFTLEADIVVTEPIESFKGMLDGNGHIIYTEGALFESMENAMVTDVVIIGGDIEADSLFGVAKGQSNVVMETVVILDSIDGAVYFSDAEKYVPEVDEDNDDAEMLDESSDAPVINSYVYMISNTVIVNDAVNGEAGLVAAADETVAVAIIDIMFIGDVNGKAGLVGDAKGYVAVLAGAVYANVTGTETAAGLVSSAEFVGLAGVYFEGTLDAENVELYVTNVEDPDSCEIEAVYAYAVDGDGAILEDVDLDAIHSGKATYEINEMYEALTELFAFLLGTEKDVTAPFVQRIGIDATPVMGEANADGSNVVIYDEENDVYKNVNALGEYTDGAFPELKAPTAPAAPNYDALNLAIEKAEGVNAEYYTAESIEALETAVAAALEARTSRIQSEIDEALDAIVVALGALEVSYPDASTGDVDVSGLTASIAAAEALKADDYTEASWATVQAVLASAKATLNSTSQALVDNAKASLDAMVAGLVKKVVETPVAIDYTKLNAAITAAEALKAADYTEATWATAQAMLTVAKNATSSDSQAAVDQAANALNSAVAGLVTAPAETPAVEEGCGSTVTGAAVALVAVLALGAGVTFKKKED